MPSKTELKQEIDSLRASLKSATERLTSAPQVTPEVTTRAGKVTVECPICHKIVEIPEYDKITRSDALKMHIEKEHSHSSGHNPICFPAIVKLESDIAKGKSHWDITNELYVRWTERKNTCLPCEMDYIEMKDALASIGSRYKSLVRPEDVKIEEIAASVREHTARELFKADSHAKALDATCGIKLPRVHARLLKMKPLAHVGRWSEFMSNRRQLDTDFELDMEDAIPGLKDFKIKMLSYIVPAPAIREVEKAITLTPEERKRLEEELTPEEKAQLAETRRLAELGRKILRGG